MSCALSAATRLSAECYFLAPFAYFAVKSCALPAIEIVNKDAAGNNVSTGRRVFKKTVITNESAGRKVGFFEGEKS